MPEPAKTQTERPPLWQRMAKLGFWFFLIKGLLWLILPVLALWFGWEVTHPK